MEHYINNIVTTMFHMVIGNINMFHITMVITMFINHINLMKPWYML